MGPIHVSKWYYYTVVENYLYKYARVFGIFR